VRYREKLEQAGVKFFEAGFLDLEGNMRLRIFPVKVFDKIASEGYGFDGYSTGFVGIEDSDLVAIPDLSTLRIYSVGDEKRALVICDIYKDDKPLEIDPRYMLRTFVKSLTYSVKVGLEPEFYLLEGGNPVDQSSYMYSILRVNVHSILTELINSLQEAHIEVTLLHHEVGPGQFEITLPYGDPVEVCDNYVFLKHLLRVCTNFRGLGATFMPKPFTGKPGNGLHIHISAIKRDTHLFGKEELSEEGMYFMGGLLKYARSICLYTNSTVNSYKRLVPGFEAPVYPVWGRGNRSVLVRIPNYRKNDTIRLEYRAPDCSGNVYLTLLAVLWAGNRGLVERVEPGSEFPFNAYRENPKIDTIPLSLEEAIKLADKRPVGNVYSRLMDIKVKEWRDYVKYCSELKIDPKSPVVSEWEWRRYLYR